MLLLCNDLQIKALETRVNIWVNITIRRVAAVQYRSVVSIQHEIKQIIIHYKFINLYTISFLLIIPEVQTQDFISDNWLLKINLYKNFSCPPKK